MNILLPCKTKADILRTAKEILNLHGHTCSAVPFESATKLSDLIKQTRYDVVLACESAVLSGVPQDVRTVYLSSEFFCPERKLTRMQTCLIAHEDLAFDFITHGARDTCVQVCGVPLRGALRRTLPRNECRHALGLRDDCPVFLMIGDTAAVSVLKSAERAVRTMYPQAQTILLGSSETQRKKWMLTFADDPNLFVSDTEMDLPLALCACDAVFTPALSVSVCAAARQNKIVTLLHSTVPRARKNAVFLHERGAAFRGVTAADSISYACRLLESDRLRGKMTDAQNRTILSDAEERLIRAIGI